MDKHELDRQCEVILERIRLEIINPIQAIEELKKLLRRL